MAKADSATRFSLNSSINFLLRLLLLLLPLICGASNEPNIEGEALIEFLTALKDSNDKIKDWDSHFVSPCFSWSHVTCINGSVVSLDLQHNSLSGGLPDSLSSMSNLQNLNLAHNNFNGSIPSSWGQLSNLKHLDLSSNDFTGKIPQQLFSIPTFKY
ncbi:hypothetical protein MIMGU_mgv1a0180832mg, partial [Erythranthe guttata]